MDVAHKSHLSREDLVAIDGDIRKSELKSLKFLSKRIISEGKLEKIEHSYELFATLLQEVGSCLSDRELELIVAQFLYLIGRNDLVSRLKFDKSFVHLSIKKSRFLSHFRINVLFELCKNLVSSDIKDFKFLLGNEIFQKSQLAKIIDGEDLMSELESLYPDENEMIVKLEKWFMDLRRKDLIDILKKYETNQSQPKDMLQETHFPSENSQICTSLSLSESTPTNYMGNFEGVGCSDDTLGFYPLNCSPRGVCLIVNNEDFSLSRNCTSSSKRLKDRLGTKVDADDLENLFKKLDFNVEVQNDLPSYGIKQLFDRYGEHDHSCYDCFFAFILSHGDVGCIYGVDGKKAPFKSLLSPFRSQNCPSLKSKPKVFFIQACQGDDIVETDDLCTDSSADPKMLEEADFLLCLATLPGFLSVRSKMSGTWYIKNLTDVIKKHYKKYDLVGMLTEVTRIVNEKKVNKDGRTLRQVPVPISTLTKRLKLDHYCT